MLRAVFGVVVTITGLAAFAPALATAFGTRDEATAMVRRVQEMFRTQGATATFNAVTSKAKIFHDRDLYPFVYDMNGVVLAHGLKADLVGKNMIDFKDQDGKFAASGADPSPDGQPGEYRNQGRDHPRGGRDDISQTQR